MLICCGQATARPSAELTLNGASVVSSKLQSISSGHADTYVFYAISTEYRYS